MSRRKYSMNNTKSNSFNPMRWTRTEWMQMVRDTTFLCMGAVMGKWFF